MTRNDRSIACWAALMLGAWFLLVGTWLGCRESRRAALPVPDDAQVLRAGDLARALRDADDAAAGRRP